MNRSELHVTELGESGPRLVFFHGLFGQGKNWTTIAKEFADDHRVLLVDMPNHGRSGWTDHLDYLDLAERVSVLLDPADPIALVGHSMGGKIAMATALLHPEAVERLAVVDVAPVAYPKGREFAGYIAGMRALDLARLESREQAHELLAEAVPSWTVRGFLLQSLRREGAGWRWLPNLDLLAREIEELGGWPAEELPDSLSYQGPVLWIAGARSDYILDEYAAPMERLFPRTRRVTIKEAGHWVHSEQPKVFAEVLRRFLAPAE